MVRAWLVALRVAPSTRRGRPLLDHGCSTLVPTRSLLARSRRTPHTVASLRALPGTPEAPPLHFRRATTQRGADWTDRADRVHAAVLRGWSGRRSHRRSEGDDAAQCRALRSTARNSGATGRNAASAVRARSAKSLGSPPVGSAMSSGMPTVSRCSWTSAAGLMPGSSRNPPAWTASPTRASSSRVHVLRSIAGATASAALRCARSRGVIGRRDVSRTTRAEYGGGSP